MIQAYKVHNYWICAVTSEVIANISFKIKDEIQYVEKHFPDKDFAKNYILKSKKIWFLASLEDYINHKKMIIESSNTVPERAKALSVCINAYNDYQNLGLDMIAKRFVTGKTFFEIILPNPNNNSYESSKHNLTELIAFCEAHIKK